MRSCTRQALERCRVEAGALKTNVCGRDRVEHVGRRKVNAEHTRCDKQTIIKLNIELLQQEDIFLQKQCVRECLLEIGHGARPDGSAYRSGVAPCRDGLPER